MARTKKYNINYSSKITSSTKDYSNYNVSNKKVSKHKILNHKISNHRVFKKNKNKRHKYLLSRTIKGFNNELKFKNHTQKGGFISYFKNLYEMYKFNNLVKEI